MKPRVHFFHGFNVFDGGKGSIDKMIPFFESQGYEVVQHDYGWTGLLMLRWKNDEAVEKALESVSENDIIVGHSNGCLIAWKLSQRLSEPLKIITIQAALRRDTDWGEADVLCLYNDKDWVVSLGRVWGRFVSVANPFKNRHGWGSAGRYGFDNKSVKNVNTNQGPFPATGHGGIFHDQCVLKYWFCREIMPFLNNK